MITTDLLIKKLNAGEPVGDICKVYCNESERKYQSGRLIRLAGEFERLFGAGRNVSAFRAPGRTEICGNHTDHNNGKVLAAGVNLDAICLAAVSDKPVVNVKSEGYAMNVIDLDILEPVKSETGRSSSLVRGVCAGFKERGYNIGGFDATTASDVISGSGLSSSAAFEVLIGTILNHLFNDGRVDAVEIAQIAQYAENRFFGKPCGLMDQTACSVGGFIAIDFKDPGSPVVDKVDFDFSSCGSSLCITDTGGSHSNLTDEYAAVRQEMEAVARALGKTVLRELTYGDIIKNISLIRSEVSDRAALRAIHFYGENHRVDKEVEALKSGDFEAFKRLVTESGYSSYMYNQNVFTPKLKGSQPVALALCLSEQLLKDKGGWRVHGGGFAGTVQAFVDNDMIDLYKSTMESVFGEGCCYVLSISPLGGAKIF
ncbi:MAG: galactokinase [Clostridiales bacterium]|nr:galactokinase [Clostridiales bacterium]